MGYVGQGVAYIGLRITDIETMIPWFTWTKFINTFPYAIWYNQDKENVVANVISRKYALLSTLDLKLLDFDHIENLYVEDPKFCEK